MTYEQAEFLALQALVHITGQEDILLGFLELSGISLENLRDSATNPATLGSILDYFLQNEQRLITFCEENNIVPTQLAIARKSFPGSEYISD